MRAACRLFDACAETDQEPHFIKLNQTSLGAAPLLFYSIISIEVVFCILAILLLPFLCASVLRAVVIHRNFRIQLCLASLYYVLGACGRLVLLPYQLLEWPVSVDDPVIFLCDALRDMVLGYFCSLLGSFAIERTIATHFWKWYELASPSTILVLIGAELTFLIPLSIGGTLCLLSVVSITSNTAVYAIMFTISTSVFLRTYIANLAILGRMEAGAALGHYFVARRFQVRENVLVMKLLTECTFYSTCSALLKCQHAWQSLHLPASLLKCKQLSYGPVDWLFARNISYAFFDLLLASVGLSFMVNVILGNGTVRNEFMKLQIVRAFVIKLTRKRKNHQSHELASIRANCNNDTNIYFTQLVHSWS